MALNLARELLAADLLPDSDPEGASMYAYDQGWLCGGRYCLKELDEEVETPDKIEGPPKWVIALWRHTGERDEFLPIAFTWDYWPVQGGSLTQIGEQLDWYAEVEKTLLVGGLYVNKEGPVVGLICWDTITGDQKFFKNMDNPVVLLPTAKFDWAEWGMA